VFFLSYTLILNQVTHTMRTAQQMVENPLLIKTNKMQYFWTLFW